MSLVRRLKGASSMVTSFGWSVMALSGASWMLGAYLGWKELMILAATCLALLVIGALSTIGKLDLTSELVVEPARVVVGERAAGSMIMTNHAKRSSRSLRVELPVGKSSALFDIPRLAPDEQFDELFVVPTSRRAIIPVGPVTTVQGDPLGLIRRTHTWSDRYEIFVHPITVRLETMAAGLVRDLEGQTTNQLTSSDIAFHTLRDYVPGDDRRHVHWKSTAKLGRLMVRQYVDTRRSHVCILLSTDLDEYGADDEFEMAVSAAASLALQAMADEQTLTVIVGGDQWSITHAKALLDRFSGVEATAGHGGLDACFASARDRASEASVSAAVVGSVATVPAMRRAASRTPFETRVVVVQCGLEGTEGYRRVGTTGFIRINTLAALRRGLMAVMT